ncbi:MAG: SH3 domain-containing protein [Acidaminococcaceae bacterium]|jgi:hypothetical protein|nr:SH3 domain-containing protein [Acidaminococcaceae bacterium]
MKHLHKICVLTALSLAWALPAWAGIVATGPLTTAEYWTKRNPAGNMLILNTAEVQAFNKKVRQTSPEMVDLANLPAQINGAPLKTALLNYSVLNATQYVKGHVADEKYKNLLKKLTNANAVPALIKPRYAVVTQRANIRTLPTDLGMFDTATDTYYDNLQETAIDPGEPVAIYHSSSNGQFYYVQSYNYRGWLNKYALGLTDKATWLKFVQPQRFLVVTGKEYQVPVGKQLQYYQQGSRILYDGEQNGKHLVTVPERSVKGQLVLTRRELAKSSNLSLGYLDYTENNIIREAFKFYGNEYGWGGLLNSVDCSSLVADAYRTCGIELPRNARQQKVTAGLNMDLTPLNHEQRFAAFRKLNPGSTIHLGKTHVMIFLGMLNGQPYVLHASSSYYDNGQKIYVRKVLVSDLNLHNKNGYTFFDAVDNCRTFE